MKMGGGGGLHRLKVGRTVLALMTSAVEDAVVLVLVEVEVVAVEEVYS